MIVVALVTVGASLAAPKVALVMANRRASDLASDSIRLGRLARANAISSGRAYVVRYDAGDDSNGRLRMWRGTNNGCNLQTWSFTGTPVEQVEAETYNIGGTHVVSVTPDPDVDICYEPSGAVMMRSGSGRFLWSVAGVTTGVIFNVDRKVGGVIKGVSRRIVFPLGGTARLLK